MLFDNSLVFFVRSVHLALQTLDPSFFRDAGCCLHFLPDDCHPLAPDAIWSAAPNDCTPAAVPVDNTFPAVDLPQLKRHWQTMDQILMLSLPLPRLVRCTIVAIYHRILSIAHAVDRRVA